MAYAFIWLSEYKMGAPQFTNAQGPGATSEFAAVDTPMGKETQAGPDVKEKVLLEVRLWAIKIAGSSRQLPPKIVSRIPVPRLPLN